MPNQVELLQEILQLNNGFDIAPSILAFTDGSSRDLNKNYSSGKNLNLAPGAGSRWACYSFLISAVGGGAFNLNEYGGIPKLTNGIRLRVKQNGVWRDFYPEPIKNNADMLHYTLSAQSQMVQFGGPVTAGLFGGFVLNTPFFVDGDQGDMLRLRLQDDFSSLLYHKVAMTAIEV